MFHATMRTSKAHLLDQTSHRQAREEPPVAEGHLRGDPHRCPVEDVGRHDQTIEAAKDSPRMAQCQLR